MLNILAITSGADVGVIRKQSEVKIRSPIGTVIAADNKCKFWGNCLIPDFVTLVSVCWVQMGMIFFIIIGMSQIFFGWLENKFHICLLEYKIN